MIRIFGVDMIPQGSSPHSLPLAFSTGEMIRIFGVDMIPQGSSPHSLPLAFSTGEMIRIFGVDMIPQGSSPHSLPLALLQTAESMGGRDWVLVTRKILTKSDVDVRQNRFFIPQNEVLWGLLSEDERRAVEAGWGVEVEVLDTRGGKYSMKLKLWPSLNKMVLNCGWRKLVEDNGLMAEVGCVDLWSFRADLKLCFALNVKTESTINN